MTAVLTTKHLVYHRGARLILDDITFSLCKGELVALLGTNGAGKSTLLRLVLGLLKPDKGETRLEGQLLTELGRRQMAQLIAYVPQGHVPVFPYTVEEIVCMGRLPYASFGQAVNQQDKTVAHQALEYLSIGHLALRPYTELSGGERQSVLIARALAQGARMLILDEPETGLDFGQQLRLAALLQRLTSEGYTILVTTHDPLHARQIFSRAILLESGRILADGPAHQVLTNEAIKALYHIDEALFRKWAPGIENSTYFKL
ncbi:ABC transporter ATP-binding protein [Zymomonas mobilis]|uniref:ABC transporter related protein n=1 Tax=Zymomonas mobilis subsp. pomaceae (strain ATCC 29192 / DSM 22645 / JCM 10191 / CCUG 17912 / NBRC 13757 / NCIMB 11200 / NRRL B-4491 / Barker I) TaxID=579138 RepID=F8EUM0_ZYMMT|nr:ABC transporter ATP-binding protein [Zymomonas mobilis]AEI38166.1 ABC transporter related protein [Zymomonas mobilis subsp. pomaceae ATCC 29192]MDX5947856.1 ABC transporter ATP-binding protein [Zymomonas mobilis subsp. pomaceae]GEB90085.1 iron ABC transporter ATP-binding protein [Zymomonas mobilis subsp. pomaceae]